MELAKVSITRSWPVTSLKNLGLYFNARTSIFMNYYNLSVIVKLYTFFHLYNSILRITIKINDSLYQSKGFVKYLKKFKNILGVSLVIASSSVLAGGDEMMIQKVGADMFTAIFTLE